MEDTPINCELGSFIDGNPHVYPYVKWEVSKSQALISFFNFPLSNFRRLDFHQVVEGLHRVIFPIQEEHAPHSEMEMGRTPPEVGPSAVYMGISGVGRGEKRTGHW